MAYYAPKTTQIAFIRQAGVSTFGHIKIIDPGPNAAVLQHSQGGTADEAERCSVLKLLKILHLQITGNPEENISLLYPRRVFRAIQQRQIRSDQ